MRATILWWYLQGESSFTRLPFSFVPSTSKRRMYQETSGVDPALLPEPQGYKVLIHIPAVKEKTAGGILLPDELKAREGTATILGKVVKMGKAAYLDTDKFPAGAYCKQGDWVLFHAYSGTKFKVKGQEYRLIDDDIVQAVVSDPAQIERA